MVDSQSQETAPPASKTKRPWVIVVVFVGIVAVVGLAALVYTAVRSATSVPSFPALADNPDSSLHGTVAYTDWGINPCVHVIAIAGAPSKQLACFDRKTEGWPSELVWLPDGRLQVTQNDNADIAKWRKIYNVSTGAVENIPAAKIPDKSVPVKPVTVNPDGARLTSTSKDGNVEVVLTETGGQRRTLLKANGGSTYEIGPPNWSPDWKTVLMTDAAARLLITTPNEPSKTYVLAKKLGALWTATTNEPLTNTK
jgi:WD40 repeat protein